MERVTNLTDTHIMKTLTEQDIRKMEETEKIIYTVKALDANCYENAVTMEQIIKAGIDLGLTCDYITGGWNGYQQGDHPWYPAVAPMMGIGTDSAVEAKEEKHLHRKKVKKDTEGRKTNVMVYWYDPFQEHEVVKRNRKATSKKKIQEVETPDPTHRVISLNQEQMDDKAASSNGKYVVIKGKLVSRTWISAHPEQAMKLYGVNAEEV